MAETVQLSANAVAVLRFLIKGYRMSVNESQLVAYRELTSAGIMEPLPGSETEYRFTKAGMEHREEILETESERIERERYAPPEGRLSDPAIALLRRLVAEERLEVTEENRSVFRELAADRIVDLGHTFAKGRESMYRFTYWGWHRRFELAEMACAKEPA